MANKAKREKAFRAKANKTKHFKHMTDEQIYRQALNAGDISKRIRITNAATTETNRWMK